VQIPFIHLKRQYESLQKEIDQAIRGVLNSAQFIGGDPVRTFESTFAKKYGVNHCISTGNGTDALFIIMKALNIGPGDEVITPAFGVIASSETITLTGAKPVFCEVDPEYFTLDPNEVIKKISPQTRAIIAVHLFGQAADVTRLKKICTDNNLYLIEDCAQSHFTKINNQLTGTFGVASAFSFYPTKNLGAYGDAGCILTHDNFLAERMRRFTNHGALLKDDHQLEGTNSRMDSIQAAVLLVKLNYLQKWNARRNEIADLYFEQLSDLDHLFLPAKRKNSNHTFHVFCIRTPYRDSLKKFLASKGIETIIHYPKGIPFTEAYLPYHHRSSDFPVTSQLQDQILSLPIFPELTDDEVHFISDAIRQYFS
jgi:dTDP-4-amino-4,6-dideoxygalactose transaminase